MKDKFALYQKVRDRLTQQLEQYGVAFWKPKVGSNVIRILPNWDDPSREFFKSAFIHWNVGENDKKIICPSPDGKTGCPVCEYVQQLLNSDLEEDLKEAKKLIRRERFACNVLDPATGKVSVFEMGPQLFKDIMFMFTDGDYGEMESLEEGRNLKIERTGTGPLDTKYSAFPAAKATKVDKKFMEEVTDLDVIYKPHSLSDIEKTLMGDAEEYTRTGAGEEEYVEEFEDAPVKNGKQTSSPGLPTYVPHVDPKDAEDEVAFLDDEVEGEVVQEEEEKPKVAPRPKLKKAEDAPAPSRAASIRDRIQAMREKRKA